MGDEWEDLWATIFSGSCFSFFLWNLAPLFFLSFLFLFCILSFLSFVSFISLSLSLSFFLSFVHSGAFLFPSLLPSLLPCFLPSFLHSPPSSFFSCLLSSFLPRIPFLSFLPFIFFLSVLFLLWGALVFRQMAADGVLEGHFCYLLVGWYRCVELLLLGWGKKENPAYFTLIRVFFQILGSLLSARYDLLWWVFSSSIMILLRSTVPCSTSSRCVWLYPHLCCELLSCVGPTA